MMSWTLTVQRDAMWLAHKLISRAGLSGQVYVDQRVAEYRRMWEQVASKTGVSFRALAGDLWQLDAGDARTRIRNDDLEFDDPVTRALAVRKPLAHSVLAEAGLQVPEHQVFTLADLSPARRFAERHPAGCVVKPVLGYAGKGVTTHVRGSAEVRRAALRAAVHGRELMIERMIPGESYRLLVLEGRVIDAVWRKGPRVTGDGRSSIDALLRAENDRRAREGHALPRLEPDRDLVFTLASQGLTLDSTPPLGHVIVLKSFEARAGRFRDVRVVYTHSALSVIGESLRRDAETAAAVVGSDFLGVDVITRDPSIPLRDSGGVINEVNTTPALHHHYDAASEPYSRVAAVVLDTLLRRSRERRARVAVTAAPPGGASAPMAALGSEMGPIPPVEFPTPLDSSLEAASDSSMDRGERPDARTPMAGRR